MEKKLKIKLIIPFLIILFVVPVFAKSDVSIENISVSSQNKDIILNATDKIDIQFNELEQSAELDLTLKEESTTAEKTHEDTTEKETTEANTVDSSEDTTSAGQNNSFG